MQHVYFIIIIILTKGHIAGGVDRADCYTELAVSSLAVAESIASTHCAYPQRDGQAELACVAGYILRCTHQKTFTHPSANWAQRRVTSLIRPTLLPLH